MRAIVLGAGASGLLHALSLRAHGVTIDSVFDPDLERARSLAEMFRARAAPSLDALLGRDAEVVAICGPPPVHVAQALRFARRERIVFVEKPIALSEDELSILEGLEGCVPVLQWRFGRALRAIRRAIQWGELGPRPTVNVDLAWHRSAAYFAGGRGSRSAWGCGALLSIGIHAIDAVLYALGGAVTAAHGALVRRDDLDVEVGASLVLLISNGAQITLRMTLDGADDRTRMTFCGAGVSAIIEGSEEDPTASDVIWACGDRTKSARLRSLELEEPGFNVGPLLVPFVGAALGRLGNLRSGRGAAELVVPSVGAAAPAHRAIFDVYASSQPGVNESSERAVDESPGRAYRDHWAR